MSVDTGDVHQPDGWFINNRLQSGSDAAPNAIGGTVERDDPLGAITRTHNFVLVKSVFGRVLRVEPKINRLFVPADIQICQREFGGGLDEATLTIPMLER